MEDRNLSQKMLKNKQGMLNLDYRKRFDKIKQCILYSSFYNYLKLVVQNLYSFLQISKLQYDYEEKMNNLLPIELKEVCCYVNGLGRGNSRCSREMG